MNKDITLKAGGEEFAAYVAQPDGGAKNLPGLILIEEIWGMTEHIKDLVRRFAAQGYSVVSPDLIDGTGVFGKVNQDMLAEMQDPAKRDEVQKRMREATAPLHQPEFAVTAIARINAAYDYLKNELGAPKIAVLGFCFGGTYSYAYATEQPALAAAIPFYGQPPKDLADVEKIACPVLAFYGEKDERLVTGLPAIEEAFTKYGKKFEHVVYPNTGHAFFNDTNRNMYNADAAADAWNKTLEFLKENM